MKLSRSTRQRKETSSYFATENRNYFERLGARRPRFRRREREKEQWNATPKTTPFTPESPRRRDGADAKIAADVSDDDDDDDGGLSETASLEKTERSEEEEEEEEAALGIFPRCLRYLVRPFPRVARPSPITIVERTNVGSRAISMYKTGRANRSRHPKHCNATCHSGNAARAGPTSVTMPRT